MKRYLELDLDPSKSDTYREHWFFNTLFDYEKLRILEIVRGLSSMGLCQDVICLITSLFMHVHCIRVWGSRWVAPLTEREYLRDDGPKLFDVMAQLYIEKHSRKVKKSKARLLACGVPKERLFIVYANAGLGAGNGSLFPYEDNYMEKFGDTKEELFYVAFPLQMVYDCVDSQDVDTIRSYLFDCMTEEEIKKFAEREMNKLKGL